MSSDDEGYIGYLLSDAARLMRTVFDRRVRKLGLTRSQWLVLSRLHRRPGASQSALAEMLEVDRASAGRMLDRMEKKGWVVRRSDLADRRINRLHLTPEARRIHGEMWKIAEGTVEDGLGDLTDVERVELQRLLARVKLRLQEMVTGDSSAASPQPQPSVAAS